MGFLKNLKAQIEAAQAAGVAMSGSEPVQIIPPFINPLPQDEVDRLLAGTGTARAIVLGKQHQTLEPGERVGSMGVKITVRQRLTAGALGEPVVVKARLSSLTASLVAPGLDIPVERDAAGILTGVASKQLTEELSGRMAEAKQNNPGFALDENLEGMIEIAKAIFDPTGMPESSAPAPNDPRRAPVEGMTWETYVAISADIAVNGAPNGPDAVAQKYKTRPGTWLALSTVWKNRIAADPELTAAFDADLSAATAQ